MTQVAIAFPEPATPHARLSVEFDGAAASIELSHTETGQLVVDINIPQAWTLTKAQALAGIAALRTLLAAAEAALTANDAVGEREGEAGE